MAASSAGRAWLAWGLMVTRAGEAMRSPANWRQAWGSSQALMARVSPARAHSASGRGTGLALAAAPRLLLRRRRLPLLASLPVALNPVLLKPVLL